MNQTFQGLSKWVSDKLKIWNWHVWNILSHTHMIYIITIWNHLTSKCAINLETLECVLWRIQNAIHCYCEHCK